MLIYLPVIVLALGLIIWFITEKEKWAFVARVCIWLGLGFTLYFFGAQKP